MRILFLAVLLAILFGCGSDDEIVRTECRPLVEGRTSCTTWVTKEANP